MWHIEIINIKFSWNKTYSTAIAEGRGQARGEVGLAAIDIRRPHLILCQLSDSQTYSNALAKINVFNPIEVK